MQLEKVKEVKETMSESEVNKYLEQGYKLLKIFSTRTKNQEYESTQPCFILGIAKRKCRK